MEETPDTQKDTANTADARRGWTIVVGVDQSEGARVAAAWGAGLARATGGRVVAVHAHTNGPKPLEEEVRDWCSPLDDLGVDNRIVIETGDPRSVLPRVADFERADLIVVGARAHGHLGEMMLGSVSYHLTHHARGPVTVVPPPAQDAATSQRMEREGTR